MRGIDHVAVETWWDEELPTFHRSREAFRTLAAEAFNTLLRLYREVPDQTRRWQGAMPELTQRGVLAAVSRSGAADLALSPRP